MTGRLRLIKLAVVGDGVPAASIEFGPGLTVVYGISNTGKSYIVEALDFMLGAKALKSIPEAGDYKHVMLSLDLPDGRPLTLVRNIGGGHFRAYRRHLDSEPSGPADFTLTQGPPTMKSQSLSQFLLEEIGLAGRQLRKNQQNVTSPLSFQHLRLLCLIDETKIQSKASPPTTGQYVNKTVELSAFKLLIEREDDSKFAQEAGAEERRKIGRGKVEVLAQAIEQILDSVGGQEDYIGLSDQLNRLNDSIREVTSSIDESLQARTAAVARQVDIANRIATWRKRLGEVRELIARFHLLQDKYESDLARLEMVREAGSLMGFFQKGVCVFCGAEVDHQKNQTHTDAEITAFGESVMSEIEKTRALRDGLLTTLEDLRSQEPRLEGGIERFGSDLSSTNDEVSRMDSRLGATQGDLTELLAKRSVVESKLGAYAQVENLRSLLGTVQPELEAPVHAPASGVSETALIRFSEAVRSVLREWSFPAAADIRYSKNENDLIVGDQPRSSHGKGVRAILHAAFTTALAQYCLARDFEHPGFVVLDSPLVTYRQPDPAVAAGPAKLGAEAPSPEQFKSVSESFYDYLGDWFEGQAIILENTDPPATLNDRATLIHFTGNYDAGRFGFFPVVRPS